MAGTTNDNDNQRYSGRRKSRSSPTHGKMGKSVENET